MSMHLPIDFGRGGTASGVAMATALAAVLSCLPSLTTRLVLTAATVPLAYRERQTGNRQGKKKKKVVHQKMDFNESHSTCKIRSFTIARSDQIDSPGKMRYLA